MSYPPTQAQLVARIRSAHVQMEALLASLSLAQMTRPGTEGEWSVKEVLAHLIAWERRLTRQLQAAARHESGRVPLFSADEPQDIDQLNAQIAARAQGVSLAELRADGKRALQELVQTLEGCSEADLFEPTGLSIWLEAPALEVIAGDSYEHYEEHLASLQRWRDGQ